MVAGGGFEPPTFGLWARRATELLHPAIFFVLSLESVSYTHLDVYKRQKVQNGGKVMVFDKIKDIIVEQLDVEEDAVTMEAINS